MKKFLIYFPKSISGLFLSILGYLNFIFSNFLLLMFTKELSTILFGTPYVRKNGFPYLSEYINGFYSGLAIYFIEFIIFLFIYLKEYKIYSKNNNSNNISIFRKILVSLGGILFIMEFIFAFLIQLCYYARGLYQWLNQQ